ncbi:MAG: hypothetical protein PHF18_00415 [Methanosarcina sp.]|nr:hypothetical protein [Methanosarcina sp.]MDD3245326.1 hypothetical protein [Methanosarcina sp.]
MSGHIYSIKLRGYPENGTSGGMPFFGNCPAIYIAIQVQVLIE